MKYLKKFETTCKLSVFLLLNIEDLSIVRHFSNKIRFCYVLNDLFDFCTINIRTIEQINAIKCAFDYLCLMKKMFMLTDRAFVTRKQY